MNAREFYAELQSLDINNPGSWPGWAHVGAIVLTGLFVIGAGSYALIKPQYEELDADRQKEQSLRTEFERKQTKVAGLDAYRAQLDTMEHDFGAMLRQLPSKSEVDNLLNDIAQARVAASLDEELFQPQSEVPKDFYAELPNKIVVTGNFHQMGAFVSGVAGLPRIVTVDEVEIRSAGAGQGAQALPKGTLRMSALAKTYRYLDAGELSAAKPAQAAGAKP